MAPKVYITDCEGPVSKNDNAYELAEAFLREGGRFFALLSKFDDYLGDIRKVPGYRYGSTLRYILPFFKAVNMTDRDVRDFSERHITIMNGVRETISGISRIMDSYMVSTSYVHYVEGVCRYVGIPMDRAYCTRLSFDDHIMRDEEKELILSYFKRFLELPRITWDEAGVVNDGSLRTIEALDYFFSYLLPGLPVFGWSSRVEVIGGEGKAEAIREIVKTKGCTLRDVVYVGDSITDTEALTLVREGGGAAISFNGNRYAVQAAEYMVVARDAAVLASMVLDFAGGGGEALMAGRYDEGHTLVFRKDCCDLNSVTLMSEATRKEVRGQAIGELG